MDRGQLMYRFEQFIVKIVDECNQDRSFRETNTVVGVLLESYGDLLIGHFAYSVDGTDPVEYRQIQLNLETAIIDDGPVHEGEFSSQSGANFLIHTRYRMCIGSVATMYIPLHLEDNVVRDRTLKPKGSIVTTYRYDGTLKSKIIQEDGEKVDHFTIVEQLFDRQGQLAKSETFVCNGW